MLRAMEKPMRDGAAQGVPGDPHPERAARSERLAAKRGFVVAIDGPAGAGKSTLAARIATSVGLPYINTGSMYRALAARALEENVSVDDGSALARLAGSIRFTLGGDEVVSALLVEGRPPGQSLTSDAVEAIVSRVASHPAVRRSMRWRQRAMGQAGCVMEGRDIASVVFPDADVKLLLAATPHVRAGRRGRERGMAAAAAAGEALARRDALDRQTTPLVPGPDTHVLDTTKMGPEEVFREAMRIIRLCREPRG
jgi:cytidylate kinase